MHGSTCKIHGRIVEFIISLTEIVFSTIEILIHFNGRTRSIDERTTYIDKITIVSIAASSLIIEIKISIIETQDLIYAAFGSRLAILIFIYP